MTDKMIDPKDPKTKEPKQAPVTPGSEAQSSAISSGMGVDEIYRTTIGLES